MRAPALPRQADAATQQRAPARPAPAPAQPAAPQHVAPVATQQDPARLIRVWMEQLAPTLGLPPTIPVRADAEAGRQVAAVGAVGRYEQGKILLHPRLLQDPALARHALAHELTHAAQARLTPASGPDAGPRAEAEAHRVSAALVGGGPAPKVGVGLGAGHVARITEEELHYLERVLDGTLGNLEEQRQALPTDEPGQPTSQQDAKRDMLWDEMDEPLDGIYESSAFAALCDVMWETQDNAPTEDQALSTALLVASVLDSPECRTLREIWGRVASEPDPQDVEKLGAAFSYKVVTRGWREYTNLAFREVLEGVKAHPILPDHADVAAATLEMLSDVPAAGALPAKVRGVLGRAGEKAAGLDALSAGASKYLHETVSQEAPRLPTSMAVLKNRDVVLRALAIGPEMDPLSEGLRQLSGTLARQGDVTDAWAAFLPSFGAGLGTQILDSIAIDMGGTALDIGLKKLMPGRFSSVPIAGPLFSVFYSGFKEDSFAGGFFGYSPVVESAGTLWENLGNFADLSAFREIKDPGDLFGVLLMKAADVIAILYSITDLLASVCGMISNLCFICGFLCILASFWPPLLWLYAVGQGLVIVGRAFAIANTAFQGLSLLLRLPEALLRTLSTLLIPDALYKQQLAQLNKNTTELGDRLGQKMGDDQAGTARQAYDQVRSSSQAQNQGNQHSAAKPPLGRVWSGTKTFTKHLIQTLKTSVPKGLQKTFITDPKAHVYAFREGWQALKTGKQLFSFEGQKSLWYGSILDSTQRDAKDGETPQQRLTAALESEIAKMEAEIAHADPDSNKAVRTRKWIGMLRADLDFQRQSMQREQDIQKAVSEIEALKKQSEVDQMKLAVLEAELDAMQQRHLREAESDRVEAQQRREKMVEEITRLEAQRKQLEADVARHEEAFRVEQENTTLARELTLLRERAWENIANAEIQLTTDGRVHVLKVRSIGETTIRCIDTVTGAEVMLTRDGTKVTTPGVVIPPPVVESIARYLRSNDYVIGHEAKLSTHESLADAAKARIKALDLELATAWTYLGSDGVISRDMASRAWNRERELIYQRGRLILGRLDHNSTMHNLGNTEALYQRVHEQIQSTSNATLDRLQGWWKVAEVHDATDPRNTDSFLEKVLRTPSSANAPGGVGSAYKELVLWAMERLIWGKDGSEKAAGALAPPNALDTSLDLWIQMTTQVNLYEARHREAYAAWAQEPPLGHALHGTLLLLDGVNGALTASKVSHKVANDALPKLARREQGTTTPLPQRGGVRAGAEDLGKQLHDADDAFDDKPGDTSALDPLGVFDLVFEDVVDSRGQLGRTMSDQKSQFVRLMGEHQGTDAELLGMKATLEAKAAEERQTLLYLRVAKANALLARSQAGESAEVAAGELAQRSYRIGAWADHLDGLRST